MKFYVRIALMTLTLSVWGCKNNMDISGTADAENPNAFICEALRVKCEYQDNGGKRVVLEARSTTGHASSDICRSVDGRYTWNLFEREPFTDTRACRQGMTRMEMACICKPANDGGNPQGNGGGQQNTGPQQGNNGNGSYRNPNVAPQEQGNFNGNAPGSPTGDRYSWGNRQTARQEYLNVRLEECATDGIGYISAGKSAQYGQNLDRAPGGYCKKVDDFDGGISCHQYTPGRVNYNIMYNCRRFYQGDFSQAQSFKKGRAGVTMMEP